MQECYDDIRNDLRELLSFEKEKVDINSYEALSGYTALHIACEIEDIESVKKILEFEECDVNKMTLIKVNYKLKYKDIEIVNYVFGYTALHIAILTKNIEIINLLLNDSRIEKFKETGFNMKPIALIAMNCERNTKDIDLALMKLFKN